MAAGGFGISSLRANQDIAEGLGIPPGTAPTRDPQRSQPGRGRPDLADRQMGIFPPGVSGKIR